MKVEKTLRGEGDRATNSLYAKNFMETGHTFTNPPENIETIKLENNLHKNGLYNELDILKVTQNSNNLLINMQKNLVMKKYFFILCKSEIWVIQSGVGKLTMLGMPHIRNIERNKAS